MFQITECFQKWSSLTMEGRQFADGSFIVFRLMILAGWAGPSGEASTWWVTWWVYSCTSLRPVCMVYVSAWKRLDTYTHSY